MSETETVVCPYCRERVALADIVRNVYLREKVLGLDGWEFRPPDATLILFVHSWKVHNETDFDKARLYAAERGQHVPDTCCQVPQVGVPLYVARLIGLGTMEDAYHREREHTRRVAAGAAVDHADAQHRTAEATQNLALATRSVAEATADPDAWRSARRWLR